MLTVVWVALGGALGTVARFGLNLAITARTGDLFPWGTLVINIVGSFVIGLFATLTTIDGRLAVSADVRLFVLVGICGGFTTFSSFSLQTLALIEAGQPLRAGLNVLASVALCLLAVWAGSLAPALLSHPPRS